jgi:hypothetical protein
LSAILVLPDRDQIVIAGSHITLSGQTFVLSEFREHKTGSYQAVFEPIAPVSAASTWPPRASIPIPTIDSQRLINVLREITPEVLRLLNHGDADLPPLTTTTQCSDSMVKDWNGGEVGPNSTKLWLMNSDDTSVEVRLCHETIRWNADEVYHQEVSAYWRVGNKRVNVFGRGEGLKPIFELLVGKDAPDITKIIQHAIGLMH